MREICFTIVWRKTPLEEDTFFERMIDFSISNKVSFGGGIQEFCLCVDIGQSIPNANQLEKKLKDFLNSNYSNKIIKIEKTAL